MPKVKFVKKKEFKHKNAKGELEEQLKNETLKKYGAVLGKDHPFNKVKKKKEIKDFEEIFIKKKEKS
jgi:hypothetical protein